VAGVADLVIIISGLHGTGKSTYAKMLSNEFGIRHVSSGELFRKIAEEKGTSVERLTKMAEKDKEIDCLIDERTKKEAEKGSVVIDGLLAGWFAKPYADIKIYLKSPDEDRIRRIAKRDGVPYEEAERETSFRENAERKRFKKFYGINLDDTSIYDYVINTSLMTLESNLRCLKMFVQEYVSNRSEET